LLGDAQHVQQIGHLQAGITVDEMHDTVMRPSEPEGLQLMIGVTDEIAVGEEQQLDDIPAQIAGPGLGERPSLARESWSGDAPEKLMSAILTYLGFNVTKLSAATKY